MLLDHQNLGAMKIYLNLFLLGLFGIMYSTPLSGHVFPKQLTYDIEGRWYSPTYDQLVWISRDRGGIRVEFNRRVDYYYRIAPGLFEDDRGNRLRWSNRDFTLRHFIRGQKVRLVRRVPRGYGYGRIQGDGYNPYVVRSNRRYPNNGYSYQRQRNNRGRGNACRNRY